MTDHPHPEMTRAEIEEALSHARNNLACAEMIDDFGRMQRETAQWRERVRTLSEKLDATPAE